MDSIRRELTKKSLIDYQLLASLAAFKLYPKLLVKLLKEAQARFSKILRTKKEEATFENVVETYLHMGDELGILFGFIDSLNGTNNGDHTRKIIDVFQPKLVAYSNEVSLSKPYYALLKIIKGHQDLTADQRRSVELLMLDMEVSGVHATASVGQKIKAINKELSKLSDTFENNVIDSRKKFFYEFSDRSSLQKMPDSDLAEAKAEAKRRNSKASHVFTLSPPSVQAILKYCSDRKVRELFYKKNNSIATEGKTDNRIIVKRILELRRKKANLLGFPTYVQYVLQTRMAKHPREILKMLNGISPRARARAKSEIKELTKFAGTHEIEEWDRTFYSEQLRQKKFDVDEKILKEYFPLPTVLSGLFSIVEKMYGIALKEIKVASYSPTVRSFEVFRNGKRIAYYVADFFARAEKRSGAWCNDLRRGFVTSMGEQTLPIIINVMNFSLPTKASPSLLTHRDVETLFHEFGHALHVMLSSALYSNLNGFHTEWDFVEFPSQFFENWCWEKSAVDLFAAHYKSKKRLPAELLKKLQKTKTFMGGYAITRQNEFAFLDLMLHLNPPPKTVEELDRTCSAIIKKHSAIPKWKGYKMYASFGHIFAGGYAAGYYSYMWAEILEADCFEKIKNLGVLNGKVMRQYAAKILEPGAKKTGGELFRSFMKRSPTRRAFIKKHGL